jgi:hypothetical protein
MLSLFVEPLLKAITNMILTIAGFFKNKVPSLWT